MANFVQFILEHPVYMQTKLFYIIYIQRCSTTMHLCIICALLGFFLSNFSFSQNVIHSYSI